MSFSFFLTEFSRALKYHNIHSVGPGKLRISDVLCFAVPVFDVHVSKPEKAGMRLLFLRDNKGSSYHGPETLQELHTTCTALY